jgi:hypothetical protein
MVVGTKIALLSVVEPLVLFSVRVFSTLMMVLYRDHNIQAERYNADLRASLMDHPDISYSMKLQKGGRRRT